MVIRHLKVHRYAVCTMVNVVVILRNALDCSYIVLSMLTVNGTSYTGHYVDLDLTNGILKDQNGINYEISAKINVFSRLNTAELSRSFKAYSRVAPVVESTTVSPSPCPPVLSLLSNYSFCCSTGSGSTTRRMIVDVAHAAVTIISPSPITTTQNVSISVRSVSCNATFNLKYSNYTSGTVYQYGGGDDLVARNCGIDISLSAPSTSSIADPVSSFVAWECPANDLNTPEQSVARMLSSAFFVPSRHVCNGVNCLGMQPKSYITGTDCRFAVGGTVRVNNGSVSDQFGPFRPNRMSGNGLHRCTILGGSVSPSNGSSSSCGASGYYDAPSSIRFYCSDASSVMMTMKFKASVYATNMNMASGVVSIGSAVAEPFEGSRTSQSGGMIYTLYVDYNRCIDYKYRIQTHRTF